MERFYLWLCFRCFWSGYRLSSPLIGVRIGEAANPGPRQWDLHRGNGASDHLSVVKVTVCNPSAVFGKTDEFQQLGGDLVFVAETSATATAQPLVRKSLRSLGYRSYFSRPVSSLKEDSVARPSLRGEALGTAILTKFPSRPLRFEFDPVIEESSRVVFSVIRLVGVEVLCASVYGFANSHPNYKRNTSILMMYCYKVSCELGLPLVMGGDFNTSVQQTPAFDLMRREGYFEMHEFVFKKFGISLPHTCGGATSNDTLVFHPMFAQHVVDAWVDGNKLFHLHDPLVVKLLFSERLPSVCQWKQPSNWATLGISKDVLQETYQCQVASSLKDKEHYVNNHDTSFQQAIQQWASDIEESVSKAVSIHHTMDPIKMPYSSLPKRFRGRCHDPSSHTYSECTPGRGSDGSYEPPCEVLRVKARQRVRQVRRLASLLKILRSQDVTTFSDSRIQGLLMEWDRICKAPGYGTAWYKWILAFEEVPMVPCGLPSVSELETMHQVTKMDCDIHCRAELDSRKALSKFHISLDLSTGFSRALYKIVGKPPSEPLLDFQHTWKADATLLRLQKGHVVVKAHESIPWTIGGMAMFENAKVRILDCSETTVHLDCQDGTLPTRGKLTQQTHLCTSREIDVAFQHFWSQYWMRDSCESQNSDDTWVDIIRDIEAMPHNIPPCVVDLQDPEAWQSTARSMKSGKAIGYDGFRVEELHLLPVEAFAHLSQIVGKAMEGGIDGRFLCARTVLLAKVAKPLGINHGRPITIFGVLIRLISKHIASQVLRHWARYMPREVSGGLPGRGVQDLVMSQQALIERNILDATPTMGYTLDLVKAFNTLPRRVVGKLLVHLGVPPACVDFWLCNLRLMKRRLQHFRYMGDEIFSTTGCPEGDCLAVAAMVAFSYFFHFRLAGLGATVFTYADNWSWLTDDERIMVQCFYNMVQLAQRCRLTIDFAKSWIWVTNAAARKRFEAIQDDIPDVVQLVFRDHAKDLGVTINYSKQKRIGPFNERFDAAIQSFQKVSGLDIPIDDKARLIQTSLFPRALYGAEFCSPSERYFQRMGRFVCKALVTDSNHASADIASHMVSKRVQDPFMFVVLNLLRNLRRYFVIYSEDARRIVQTVANFQGKRSCGPGSSLALLLRRVGWNLNEHGILQCGVQRLDLTVSCNREIVKFLDRQWDHVVLQRCLHRKGFNELFPMSARLTRHAVGLLPDTDKRILVQYLTGSFQSDAVKAMWDKSVDGKCPLCGGDDTKDHRLLVCETMHDLRTKHHMAVTILREYHHEWIWAPIARSDPNEQALAQILESRKMPEVFLPFDVTSE